MPLGQGGPDEAGAKHGDQADDGDEGCPATVCVHHDEFSSSVSGRPQLLRRFECEWSRQ